MPNTGKKIILNLKEETLPDHTPTGVIKPNVATDPDYIAPYTDTTACPVVFTTACPAKVLTHAEASTLYFEFGLPDSTLVNPALATVKVILKQTGAVVSELSFAPPFVNYFGGSFTDLSGTYTISVELWNATPALLSGCPDLVTVTL